MNLTPRLKKIADLIPENCTLADIGTDHAYLPIYCLLNGKIKKAVASDINKGPLLRARENVKRYGLERKIDLRLSDGIEGLGYGEADVIVIAGMGGLLIGSILERAESVLKRGTFLILQPMIAQKELRKYLYSGLFSPEGEYLAEEDGRIYNIITVRYGLKCDFDDRDIIIGRNLKKNSPHLFERYAANKEKTLKKIISGIQGSSKQEEPCEVIRELEFYRKELEGYEDR